MRAQSFYDWLLREVATSRMALVGLYEQKDKLLYVEAPPIRKRYMEAIGNFEESVLEAELEVSLLRRKIELIQISINRHEPIDLQAIEAILIEERNQKVSELEAKDATLNDLPQLDESEKRTLQRLYREITDSFHPAINPDITDTQKELYEKAQEAYRTQDVEAMKLIYDMLFSPIDKSELGFEIHGANDSAEKRRNDYREFATALSTDYKLAKKLYSFFMPTEEDAVVRDSLEMYNAQRQIIEEEIANIRKGFPFNAVETLNDKNKTEEYLAELRLRAKQSETEKSQLEQRINELIEGVTNG